MVGNTGPSMNIDLHTHSSASDGTTPPDDLVRQAALAGLDVLALTDHDTTAGWDDAIAALPPGLALVPGAEISCVYADTARGPIAVHLLALLFDRGDIAFAAARCGLRESRLLRGRHIVDRLVAGGFDLDWDRVLTISAGAPVGRPHIALGLVEIGAASSVPDAFARLLGSDGPYYVRKADLDVIDAIALVRGAGGVPVFAHPFAHRRGRVLDEAAIAGMARAGLLAIEVHHPDHDAVAREHAREIADRFGLVGTGSSDFHGSNKTTPLAAERTDPAAYHRIVELASGARPVVAVPEPDRG